MSDETIASLGFEVASQPLKDATQDLKSLSDQAGKTGKDVDGLNQSFDKTAPVVGKLDAVAKQLGVTVDELKAGIAGAKDGVVNLKTGLDGLGTSTQKTGDLFADMSKNIAAANQQVIKTGSETQAIGSAMAASIGRGSASFDEMRKGIGAVNGAIGALPPPLNAYTAAVDHASAAHGGLSGQQQALIHSLRSLGEQFASGQISMMSFTQQIGHLSYAMSGEGGITGAFSGLARMIGPGGLIIAGIAAATAAFFGLDHAVSSAAQAVEASKGRFDALGGVKLGDEYSKGLEQLTKSLGVTRDAIQPTFEALLKLDFPMFGHVKFSADEATAAIRTVFQELKLGGIETKAATEETGKFFDDLIKKQGLTGDALRNLEKISPEAANAITFALTNGAKTTAQYAAELDKLPESISRVMDGLHSLAGSSDQATKNLVANPKNVSQAWEKLGIAFSNIWDQITGADKSSETAARVSKLTTAINTLADGVIAATPAIVTGLGVVVSNLSILGTIWFEVFNRVVTAVKLISSATTAAAPVVVGAFNIIKNAIGSVNEPISAALAGIKGFVNEAVAFFNALGQAAVQAGQNVAAAISDGVQKGLKWLSELPGKGLQAVSDFADKAISIIKTWGASLASSISDGLSSALDAIKKWAEDALGPLVGWARQAIAIAQQVAAALGAASNQPVSAPEGVGTTGAIDPLPAFASGTDDAPGGPARINEQGGEIVNLPSGSQVIPHDISMQMAAAGGSAAGVSSEVSSAGADKIVTAISALSGGYHGTGGTTLGDEAHQTSDLISAHVASSLKDQTQSLKDAIGAQTSQVANAITSIVTAINSCCGQLVTAINAVDADVKNIHLAAANSNVAPSFGSSVVGSAGSSNGYSGSFNDMKGMQIADPALSDPINFMNQFSVRGGGLGNQSDGTFGSPWSLNDSKPTAPGPVINGPLPDNSSSGGQGRSIGSGNSSGGRGGPGYNYGSFATGGSFIVGGDGGTDTTPVSFMATRGETVEIKQAGASATPSGVSVQSPGSGAAPSAAPAQSAAPVTHKYVTINVQQGVQADTFIRSRAQIAQAA